MPNTRPSHKLLLLLAALPLVGVLLAASPSTQETRLGQVHFATSTRSEAAQGHFLRGLAALHSFWYPLALDEFRAATQADPGFMMGYWGEAMTYNRPLWWEPQQTEAARKALAKLKDTQALTPKEQAYLHAVTILYGEGDKPSRDRAYAAAMEEVQQTYPEDLDAACFHALALLGSIQPGDPDALRKRMRAGAIASAVYAKAPDHPGAAHYILHAFDDPDHAILALPAARRYAGIAPAAPHALHMPAHIFLQLGMWAEAAAANEAAWTASEHWVKNHNLPVSQREYHTLHWLQYVYLQQGRYKQAADLLATMHQSLPEFPKDDTRLLAYGTYIQSSMAAAWIVETERWNLAAKLPSPGKPSGKPDPHWAAIIFAQGLAAAMQGSAEAQDSIATLRAMAGQSADGKEPLLEEVLKFVEIQALEIAAVASAQKGNHDEALASLKKASTLEDALPPDQGPPLAIKPSHELYGEILLRAGRPEEAAQQFAASLFRNPDRARSLLGAARAAAQSGDTQGATHAYALFSQRWQQSDAALPELKEAQDYLNRPWQTF